MKSVLSNITECNVMLSCVIVWKLYASASHKLGILNWQLLPEPTGHAIAAIKIRYKSVFYLLPNTYHVNVISVLVTSLLKVEFRSTFCSIYLIINFFIISKDNITTTLPYLSRYHTTLLALSRSILPPTLRMRITGCIHRVF